MMTKADEGGRGVIQMLTIADEGGGGGGGLRAPYHPGIFRLNAIESFAWG